MRPRKQLLEETIEPFAEIGILASSLRKMISRFFWPMVTVLAFTDIYLGYNGHPGTVCFALVAAGSCLMLHNWSKQGVGLPLLPMTALQTLVVYCLPILVSNESIMSYPGSMMTDAGIEVLVYCASMMAFWRIGMLAISPAKPYCFALQGFEDEELSTLKRIGFGLVIAATGYAVLQATDIYKTIQAMLPAGSNSIITAVLSGTSTCGFFVCAIILGKGKMTAINKAVFWSMFGLMCFVGASAFLLSSTITFVSAILLGLFWSTGRFPWKFLIMVFATISFLNIGKFTMREKYWHQGTNDPIPVFLFSEMPGHYAEWIGASLDDLTGAQGDDPKGQTGQTKEKGQRMSDRINNLQNMLFIIDAVKERHLSLMGGDTYTLIPQLLIPRIFWPEKPRSHEGQVVLNVHFGRQDLNSTLATYIAWGLPAEAYGNFGPILGALLLGMGEGLFFAWVERYTARKLLLSTEGFLAFTLFVGMANSFEMVASVLVTVVFQSFFPIIAASMPFVRYVNPKHIKEEMEEKAEDEDSATA